MTPTPTPFDFNGQVLLLNQTATSILQWLQMGVFIIVAAIVVWAFLKFVWSALEAFT